MGTIESAPRRGEDKEEDKEEAVSIKHGRKAVTESNSKCKAAVADSSAMVD